MKIYCRQSTQLFCFVSLLLVTMSSAMAGSMDEVKRVQQTWDKAKYQLEDKQQEKAFEELVAQVEALTAQYPDAAEVWVWSGIVKSTYAGIKGGLGALSLAKQSRADLEQAVAINGEVLDGSAYTSLATLYAQVPGWPIGFGSDKKATKLFDKALALNPKGIDPNYFYAEYMYEQGKYEEAKKYYLIAQHAAPRPGREVGDAGRQDEILTGLDKTNKKLSH